MPRNNLQWGDWNAICDVCGLKHKASEMKKRWDGLMVCPTDWEPRHPQDFLRVRPDSPAVPWTRPEPEDDYVFVCFLWSRSGYVGLAEVGCALVGSNPFSYAELYSMKWPVAPEFVPAYSYSSIPGYAIPGLSRPGNPDYISP